MGIKYIQMLSAGLLLIGVTISAPAADWLHRRDISGPFMDTYKAVYTALEDVDFYVVKELNIGANLQRLAYRWGDDYNRNRFTEVRSMVICNASFANKVLNADPEMMALCPLTITLLHKENNTMVLYERVGELASGRPGGEILQEVDKIVINALEQVTP